MHNLFRQIGDFATRRGRATITTLMAPYAIIQLDCAHGRGGAVYRTMGEDEEWVTEILQQRP